MPSKNDVIYDFSENVKKVSLLTGLGIIVVIIVQKSWIFIVV